MAYLQHMLTSGDITLTLAGVLCSKGQRRDLVVSTTAEDGVWKADATAIADSFNSMVHDVRLQVADGRVELTSAIKSDPWVLGGPLRATVTLTREGDTWTGTYTGEFNGEPVSGTASAAITPTWVPIVTIKEGLPAILQEFEAHGPGRLADFSYAGYHGGQEPPHVEGPVFPVEAYGARPDSGEDATEAVQHAIDAAAAAGGGVVQFPEGRFVFSYDRKRPGLEISSSNIVIRGAGSGWDGTVLMCLRPSDSPNPAQMWRANEYPVFFHAGHTTAPLMGGYGPRPQARLTGILPAPRHALRLRVDAPQTLQVGTTYLLTQLEDAEGSLGQALVAPGKEIGKNYQGEGKPLVTQYVTVLAIDGDEITIDTPLHWETRPAWRPALWTVPMLREVGIEHLRLQSTWEEYFEHHKNAKHDDGYDHIRFDGVEHGWVRDIVHDSPTSSVTLMGTKHCTIMDGAVVGNAGHNAYAAIAACTANLFYRLDGNCAMHTFGLQGTPCGTVYLDCQGNEPAGIDMHGGVGLDNLYDNLIGCVNVGGGAATAVPPRNSHGFVLWNWQQGRFNPYRAWRHALSMTKWHETPAFIAVGVRGRDGHRVCYRGPEGIMWSDVDAPWGYVEALNQEVAPRSLYRYQMLRRTGDLPAYLRTKRL